MGNEDGKDSRRNLRGEDYAGLHENEGTTKSDTDSSKILVDDKSAALPAMAKKHWSYCICRAVLFAVLGWIFIIIYGFAGASFVRQQKWMVDERMIFDAGKY